MAKKNYMALDDVQSIWTDKQKPWINQKFDEFAGPTYDEQAHGFDFPSTSKMTYDSVDHGFVFG